MFFLAIDKTFLWKNCAKNSTFDACFHISSANKCTKWHLLPARKYGRSMQGLWCTQLFWGTHYKWRTRFEWRTHRVDRTSLHYQHTLLIPRPHFGPRANPVIRRGELWFEPFQNALLHSLLGAMFNWKFNLVNEFDRCICDHMTQLNGAWWKPGSNISTRGWQPLDFFPFGASLQNIDILDILDILDREV